MSLDYHLLGHTNARQGWTFSDQELEVRELRKLEGCVTRTPVTEGCVTVTPVLECNIACTSGD